MRTATAVAPVVCVEMVGQLIVREHFVRCLSLTCVQEEREKLSYGQSRGDDKGRARSPLKKWILCFNLVRRPHCLKGQRAHLFKGREPTTRVLTVELHLKWKRNRKETYLTRRLGTVHILDSGTKLSISDGHFFFFVFCER